ncbi:hypothetical protein KAI46_01660 [bacterium]|nr:hypothetical protein [bacterium]
MFDNNIPIPKVVVQPVLAGDRARSGGRAYRQGVDVCGRVLNVRRGRHRPRRYSPVPYGGVNRRLPNDQRRALGNTDRAGDRVITLLVPAGAKLDGLIGKDISLRIS